jgi:hypothetical protein
MPNITPSDVHALRPVGTEPKRHSFSQDEDSDFKRIQRARKRKTAKATKDIPWFEGTTGVPDMTIDKPTQMMQKSFHSAQSRRKSLKAGNALQNPDGTVSYPINNTKDLRSAAILARSGHGNVAAAKRLIARRSRELGVANPLAKTSVSKALENHIRGPVPLISYLAKHNA